MCVSVCICTYVREYTPSFCSLRTFSEFLYPKDGENIKLLTNQLSKPTMKSTFKTMLTYVPQTRHTHTHTHTQTHTYTHRAAADKFIFRRQRLKNVNLTMD